MNYAIIRNAKYTIGQLNVIYRHNERKNTNYSNQDINRNISKVNYSIKECNMPYSKKFNELKKQYHLQGKIKSISNVACEYIITASPTFFEGMTDNEIKRYFKTAYKFVCNFKNLGEEYIISAKVHLDESNPHMHLVYLPVVHSVDKKSGQPTLKLCCSDFWKGKNSYKILQDHFYQYMTKAGFDLDRGNTEDNKHIKIADLKQVTNYEIQKYEKETVHLEQEIDTKDIEILKKDYKRVIKKFNTLAKQYTRIKVINNTNLSNYEKMQKNTRKLEEENKNLKKAIKSLGNYIEKSFECISTLFDWPIERLKRIVNHFVRESDEYESSVRKRQYTYGKRER